MQGESQHIKSLRGSEAKHGIITAKNTLKSTTGLLVVWKGNAIHDTVFTDILIGVPSRYHDIWIL